MDTSLKYIKQCEKAMPDLRRDYYKFHYIGFIPTPGCGIRPNNVWMGECKGRLVYAVGNTKSTTILPTQDQLQEMVKPNENTCAPLFHIWQFNEWWNTSARKDYTIKKGPLKSMEQLWLAFVMKEKYSKVWLNGEWICQK